MADVNDIVVIGFGSWSSVNSLPTLGYGGAGPGIFSLAVGNIYSDGVNAGQRYSDGASAGQGYADGARAGQGIADGADSGQTYSDGVEAGQTK